jgi:S-adenosylhomocysteine hydrolase
VNLPQALDQTAQIGRQAVDAVVVDLHQVAGRVSHVHLNDVAGQLHEVVAEGDMVKGAAALGHPVDRLEVGDGDPEMVMAGRLQIALEQMQLRVAERQPLHGDAEVGRRDALGAEELGVEVDRLLEVERVDADVVDPRAHPASRQSGTIRP